MITFLFALAFLGAYFMVTGVVLGTLTKIREYDEVRSKHTKKAAVFEHDSDGVEVPLALMWPIVGVPALMYHLAVIGWDREERKLVKELVNEKTGGRRGTKEQLCKAIDEAREQRHAELQSEIETLREKAEA